MPKLCHNTRNDLLARRKRSQCVVYETSRRHNACPYQSHGGDCKGFFVANAGYSRSKLENDCECISIEIPDGWDVKAIISRICCAGLCSYTDIRTCKVNIFDIYRMLELLDWRDFVESKQRANENERD